MRGARGPIRCGEEDEDTHPEGDGEPGEQSPLPGLDRQGIADVSAQVRQRPAGDAEAGHRALRRPCAESPHLTPSAILAHDAAGPLRSLARGRDGATVRGAV